LAILVVLLISYGISSSSSVIASLFIEHNRDFQDRSGVMVTPIYLAWLVTLGCRVYLIREDNSGRDIDIYVSDSGYRDDHR
jgi:hypothetical protein